MKLSELTGEAPATKSMKLSQVTGTKAEKPKSQYHRLVAGLPDDVAARIIEENTVSGRGAETRTKSAIKKAADMERLRLENPYQAEIIEEMNPAQRFAVGAGEGLTNLGRGVGLVGPKDATQEKMDNTLRGQSTAAQVGKITAQALPMVAAGGPVGNIASQGLRVAAGSGIGAAEGNIIARGEGGNSGEIVAGTLFGGALGGAGEALVPLANNIGQSIARKLGMKPDDIAKVKVDAQGKPSAEYEAVLQQSGKTPEEVSEVLQKHSTEHDLNAAREKSFRDLGLEFTEAERTRDRDLWVEQSAQQRKSGKVSALVDKRESQLNQITDAKIDETGGVAPRASNSTYDAIIGKSTQLDNEINELYKVARESAPTERSIRFESTIDSLKENAPSNEMSGGVVNALRKKMQAMGVMKKWKPSGRVNIEQAEELRKYANRLSQSANGEGRYIIRQFKQQLDDDVFKGVDDVTGQDLFTQARGAKARFETDLSTNKLNKFDKNEVSLVRDILDNKINQDVLAETIVKRSGKYRSKHLSELKDYLQKGTPEQIEAGTKAWDDIRASALTQIKEKAFMGLENREGSKRLAPSGLRRGMAAIGEDKLKVLFSPKERKFLDDLMAVAINKTQPEGSYAPSQPAIAKIGEKITRAIPFFGDMLSGISSEVKSRSAEKKLLNLVKDAEVIAKENKKLQINRLRKSNLGATIQSAPLLALPTIAAGDE